MISFTDYREDIAAFIALADIVVVASTGTAAQSRVVPQAFAMKKTVVSSNVGGLPELVKHEVNGLLVLPANADKMAESIQRLLIDNILVSRLGQHAYILAQQQLSFSKMIEKTLSLYQRLL